MRGGGKQKQKHTKKPQCTATYLKDQQLSYLSRNINDSSEVPAKLGVYVQNIEHLSTRALSIRLHRLLPSHPRCEVTLISLNGEPQ